jgi:hypothetical protein
VAKTKAQWDDIFGGSAFGVGMSVLVGSGDLGAYSVSVKKGEVLAGEVGEGEKVADGLVVGWS